MKLFKFEDYKLVISEEALLIKDFAAIWKRDRTVDKKIALMELGYIYFLVDPRSDYSFILDETEKSEIIKKQEGLPSKWKPDDLVKSAIDTYKFLTQTTSSLMLHDVRAAMDKLRLYIRDLDLSETDKNDKPKYTLNSYTSALSGMPDLIEKLIKIEKIVHEELEETGRMRANKMKKVTEDGFANFIS